MKRYVDGVETPVGQETMAESRPVVIASDQTPVPVTETGPARGQTNMGVVTPMRVLPDGTVVTSGGGGGGGGTVDQGAAGSEAWPVILHDALSVDLIGQRTMAGSLPVAVASDQSPVPITAATLPLPADAATNTSLGTDGSAAPANGTGIRGWLHGISDYLAGTLQANITDRVGRLLGIAEARLYDAAGVAYSGANPVRTDPTGTTAQPVTDNGGSLTTDTPQLPAALVAGRLVVDGSGVTQPVSDAGGSITVDAPVATPVFARLSDGSNAQGTSVNPLFVSTTSSSTSTVGFNRVNLDAFLRLRVSEPHTLFDSKFTTDNGPAFWDDVVASGAGTSSTYTQALAQVSLGVSNLTAGSRVRQTFRRFNYQSGKSQLLMFTGVFGAPQAGITRRIGQFTSVNGYIFEVGPTNAAVVLRLNSVDNPIPQAAWNIDTFSGLGGVSNPSGIALDFSKNQILVINYEWLGVGSAWFGFVVGGVLYWAHRFDHSNLTTGVYVGTPNLPLRYEINNDGTGGAASLVQICSTVISEGGRVATGLPRAADRGATPLTMNLAGVLFPVFNLRIAPDTVIPGASGSLVEILSWDIVPTGNDPLLWRVLVNPTFAGVALAWTTATQSAVQFATPTNATTVTAGTGVQIEGGYISASARGGGALAASLGSDFALGTYYNGTPQILSIVTQRLVGAVDIYSSASWRETS
jgi:hypothetical protein